MRTVLPSRATARQVCSRCEVAELRSAGQMRTSAPTWFVAIFGDNGAFSDNIPCANLWQHDDMHDEPELIATLQVGLAASDECSERHEVLIVKTPAQKPNH